MKILRKTALWLGTLLYLILVLGFVRSRYDDQMCNRIEVSVEDSAQMGFIHHNDVLRLLDKQDLKLFGMQLDDIALDEIEQAVTKNQLVKVCKAYTGVNGCLHIDITQREPLVRVIEQSGKSFYLDRKGNVLNTTTGFSPHVLVISGYVRSGLNVGQPINVFQLPESKQKTRLLDLLELATFIDSEEFWKAQIVQVYCNASGEYELIPRVGPHVILLGSMDRYEQKFKKLKVFYQEGLNTVGWNHYLKINLKYKDQVVCTKI